MVGTRASTARKLAAAGPQADLGLTRHTPIVVDDDNVSVTSELSSVPGEFDDSAEAFASGDENDDDATTDLDSDNESIFSHITVAAARIRAVSSVTDDSDSELTELPEDYQNSVFDDHEADDDIASLDYNAMDIEMTMEELLEFDFTAALDDAPQAVHVHDTNQAMRDLAALENAAQALHENELNQAGMEFDDTLARLNARIESADDNNNVLQDDMADDIDTLQDVMAAYIDVPQDDIAADDYDEEFAELNALRANATPAQAAMLATYFASGAGMTFDELRDALTMSDELCQWPYGADTQALDNEFRELMALKRNNATRAQALVIESHLGYGNTLTFEMFRNILGWGDDACETYLVNCFRGVYDEYMAEKCLETFEV